MGPVGQGDNARQRPANPAGHTIFVNKVLLQHNQTHPCTFYLPDLELWWWPAPERVYSLTYCLTFTKRKNYQSPPEKGMLQHNCWHVGSGSHLSFIAVWEALTSNLCPFFPSSCSRTPKPHTPPPYPFLPQSPLLWYPQHVMPSPAFTVLIVLIFTLSCLSSCPLLLHLVFSFFKSFYGANKDLLIANYNSLISCLLVMASAQLSHLSWLPPPLCRRLPIPETPSDTLCASS